MSDGYKNLAALDEMVRTGLVPRAPEWFWEPHEQVALTRWESGERTDHVARALSASLLCLSPWDMDELVVNGPILAESCIALGDEAKRLAERFFVWVWRDLFGSVLAPIQSTHPSVASLLGALEAPRVGSL